MKLTEWCDVVDAQLRVVYYSNQNNRWCAKIEGMECIEGSCLASIYGNGKTPYGAILDLIRKCGGKRVVFNAYQQKLRKEVNFPKNLEFEV